MLFQIELPDDGGDGCRTSSMLDLDINKEFKCPTISLSIGSILNTPRKIQIKSELYKCRNMLSTKKKVIDNRQEKKC